MANFRIKKRIMDKEFRLSDFTDLYNMKARCCFCGKWKWCQEVHFIFIKDHTQEKMCICESCNSQNEQSLIPRILARWNTKIRETRGIKS